MERKSLNLLIINLLAAASAALTLTRSDLLWLRAPAGLLMALILPGYIWSAVLFPRAFPSMIERLAVSILFSLAIGALGGLFLYLVAGSLNPDHWAYYLEGAVLLGSGVTILLHKYGLDKEQHDPEGGSGPAEAQSETVRRPQLLLYGLALVIVIGSVLFARYVALYQPQTDIVQLSMIPDQSDPAHTIHIGVSVQTAGNQQFGLILKRGNFTIKEWPHLDLQPDGRWEVAMTFPAPVPGAGPYVAYLVNLNDPSQVYRQVSLWPGGN